MFTKTKFGLLSAALMMIFGARSVAAQRVNNNGAPFPVPECCASHGTASIGNNPGSFQAPPLTANSKVVSPVTHVRSWYDNITYTWYDNTDGTGTAHTAKLTDPATDPHQIFYMIKSIYTDPNVPGFKYDGVYDCTETTWSGYEFTRLYQPCPPYGINSAVTRPYENGYTVCLVKVKNSYSYSEPPYRCWSNKTEDVMNMISGGIEEMDLLTDGMRVGEGSESSGTVFQYTGELNRFFFVSKQKTYKFQAYNDSANQACDMAPFYAMYEEFSPTTTDSGSEITDFYPEMIGGDVYNVIHDCQGVMWLEHYFSMSGKAGTDYYNMNCLVFYLPDYRSQSNNRNYNTSHQPHVGLYIAKLEADIAADDEGKEHVFDVTVDWSTNLDLLCNNTVAEDFEVHAIWTNPMTGEEMDSVIYTGSDTHCTYEVPQYMEGYTINYVVRATPHNATNNANNGGEFYTWSNVDDVPIPGYYDFFMLKLHHYESDFVIEEEYNYYRNYVYPKNMTGGAGYTLQEIKDGYDHFVLYRTSVEENVPIADLYFKEVNGKVFYKIDYRDVETIQHPLNNTND